MTIVRSADELDELYGAPSQRSLDKEIDYVSEHYRAFIERAPFAVLSTCGEHGIDNSPRGDAPGFVKLRDSRTLLLPDRRGNNRLDTLRNVLTNPKVGLLFLIPGVGETLRVKGRAEIDADPALCAQFDVRGKVPRTVLVIHVERVYFQCQKALARSRLWDPSAQVERTELPSTGTMLAGMSSQPFDADAYDAGYADHMQQTIY